MTADVPTAESIETALVDVVRDIAVADGSVEIRADEDFLADGLLDSFGFISLLKHVEDFYRISIGEDEQFDERIRTIRGMAAFISEKLNAD